MLREGTVVKIHGTKIDVKINGSTRHLRGIDVVGGIAGLSLQDKVTLSLVGRRYVAQSYQTAPKNAVGLGTLVSSTTGSSGGSSHDEVTLAADADVVLALNDQELQLDTQGANEVFAGPVSGGDTDPDFRALVDADIPAAIARDAEVTAAIATHAALGDVHHAEAHVTRHGDSAADPFIHVSAVEPVTTFPGILWLDTS